MGAIFTNRAIDKERAAVASLGQPELIEPQYLLYRRTRALIVARIQRMAEQGGWDVQVTQSAWGSFYLYMIKNNKHRTIRVSDHKSLSAVHMDISSVGCIDDWREIQYFVQAGKRARKDREKF